MICVDDLKESTKKRKGLRRSKTTVREKLGRFDGFDEPNKDA